MMNVEVIEGGIRTRRGWERWNVGGDIVGGAWAPTVAFVHERASGLDSVIVHDDTSQRLYWSLSGTFAPLTRGGGVALPVGSVSFAPWGDTLYMAVGNARGLSWDGASPDAARLATVPNSVAFADDYLVPGAGGLVPADHIASHGGRLWVASTHENGTPHPHRVRWSHPGVTTSWASYDYVDILEGGGPITGIVPMGDHLLVFKASSVWAIFGYDGASQQLINVSRSKGARSTQMIARSEHACYFVSMPDGVFRIENGTAADEVSFALRPMLTSQKFNSALADEQWLGWVNNRLWWSVPYADTGVAAAATVSFVFDPAMGNGGTWTKFQAGDGLALGPFAQGGYAQGSSTTLGFARSSANVVVLDFSEEAKDNITGLADVPFETRFTTGWINAGLIDIKKRWKRPTFVALDTSTDYTFQVSVRENYSSGRVTRKFGVDVRTAQDGIRYGDGSLYGDGSVYSVGFDNEMQMRRGNSLGTSAATQLQLDGEPGVAWGIGAIVLKYRARRIT